MSRIRFNLGFCRRGSVSHGCLWPSQFKSHYSCLSAPMGSTFVARRAGT